jgi:membrane-associated protein
VNADAILSLVPVYGAAGLFAVTLLACFGLPIPAALGLLAGGAFVASGDLALVPAALAALAGAVIGDQGGYWLGIGGGGWVEAKLRKRGGWAATLNRARRFSARWGAWAVFLSRWAVSPLGPPVNLAAGSLRMPWARFSLASLAGEGVWVGGYFALGFLFADSFVALAATLGDLGRALAAAAVALFLGLRLRTLLVRAARNRRRRQSQPERRNSTQSRPERPKISPSAPK